MTFLLWREHIAPGHCTLGSPRVKGVSQMHAGLPFASEYGGNVVYAMSPLFPDDILLSDNFAVAGQVIVSEALKSHLQSSLADHAIEYLPVTIHNHQGRVASDKYFIMHPLGTVDCIDIDRSKVKWNALKERTIISCKGLVFKPNAVPASVKLFRPLSWGQRVMVTQALADELMATGLTGLHFTPAEGFNGIS